MDYSKLTVIDADEFRRRVRQGESLSGISCTNEDLTGSMLMSLDMTGSDFEGCNFNNAEFRQCDLTGSELSNTDLEGAMLANCTLYNIMLDGAALADTKFFACPGFRDGGIDDRGYRFVAVKHDAGWMVQAGCRWFTAEQALEHWEFRENSDALARAALLTGDGVGCHCDRDPPEPEQMKPDQGFE